MHTNTSKFKWELEFVILWHNDLTKTNSKIGNDASCEPVKTVQVWEMIEQRIYLVMFKWFSDPHETDAIKSMQNVTF